MTADELTDEGTGGNTGERLVLVFVVVGDPIGGLTFTVWDAAVPVLPVTAHLLLAGFLAFGGYQRYRR